MSEPSWPCRLWSGYLWLEVQYVVARACSLNVDSSPTATTPDESLIKIKIKMTKTIDLTGQIFGRLTVVKHAGIGPSKQAMWLCDCECGNTVTVRGYDLYKERSRSCGCLRTEVTISRSTKHGGRDKPTYPVWNDMMTRCYNRNSPSYADYGGRGITVCDRWHDLNNFLEDMGDRPKGLSIERVNNEEGYSPENCVWATTAIQSRNRRNNRKLTYNGETLCVTDWAAKLGIKQVTLSGRLHAGWSVERALSTSTTDSWHSRRGLSVSGV